MTNPRKLFPADVQPVETTASGAELHRWFRDTSRSHFDQLLCRHGWQQYDTDQDAWYFGVWVDVEGMAAFTYAEGDWMLVISPDRETFIRELARMAEFYGEAPPFAIAYAEDGQRTEFFDERPTGEIHGAG